MIDYLLVENFKSLKRLQFKPASLNLCFGMNGVGKSTLLQIMLLLRQSHERGVLESQGTAVAGWGYDRPRNRQGCFLPVRRQG